MILSTILNFIFYPKSQACEIYGFHFFLLHQKIIFNSNHPGYSWVTELTDWLTDPPRIDWEIGNYRRIEDAFENMASSAFILDKS